MKYDFCQNNFFCSSLKTYFYLYVTGVPQYDGLYKTVLKAIACTKEKSYLSDCEVIVSLFGAQKGVIGLKQINYKLMLSIEL